jgi:hypothetical protein
MSVLSSLVPCIRMLTHHAPRTSSKNPTGEGDTDPRMAHMARRMGGLGVRAPSLSVRRKGIQDEVEAKLAQEFDARLQTTPADEAAVRFSFTCRNPYIL